jgi:hypothetical protein
VAEADETGAVGAGGKRFSLSEEELILDISAR